jgi:hypothetical protein
MLLIAAYSVAVDRWELQYCMSIEESLASRGFKFAGIPRKDLEMLRND